MDLVVVGFSILNFILSFSVTSANEIKCAINNDTPISLSLTSKRNKSGDWVTNFSLSRDDSEVHSPNYLALDLTQSVAECEGKRKVYVRGVISGISESSNENTNLTAEDELLFHTKCGKNVAVISNGRTDIKINLEHADNAVVYTNRPLKINELLEVKLEGKHNKFSYSFAIGVTTLSPLHNQQLPHINSIVNESWAMYHGNAYHNGKQFISNYGKKLDDLEVGARVGVMRSNTGSLHYFVNGEDQGPAASNVPFPVYGLVELSGNAVQATIVKP